MREGAPHRVLIIGGGFGGLEAAKNLRRAPVEVTLIDRRNHHVFQPLLYQVATGGLSPGDIAWPLRHLLRKQRNARVVMGEVSNIDVARRAVCLGRGKIEYDTLIVAAGASHSYFGNDRWAVVAPGLKTIEQASEIRRRILYAFEAAEIAADPQERSRWLGFVIIGAGPTGVELAGTLGEIARDTLAGDFRNVDPAEARIVLLDRDQRVLPQFPPDLSYRAEASLIRLGVQSRVGLSVIEVDADGVTVEGPRGKERIDARTVIWAAGVEASPLGELLGAATGSSTDRAGRILAEPDFSLPGYPEVLVIGDLADYRHDGGRTLPGLAPVAMQEGRWVARLILARLRGRTPRPFHYVDKGTLATIGRHHAVAVFGRLHFHGWLAWFLWLFIHLLYLVSFQSRVLVAIQWAFSYFTYNRSARLILGVGADPARRDQGRN